MNRCLCLIFFAWVSCGLADQKYYHPTNFWKTYVGYGNPSSPAMDLEGVIYVTAMEGNLYAINPDGQYRWKYHFRADTVSTPAIGPDGTIYFGARDRKLHAVGNDGKKKWTFKTGRWVDASPALGEDCTIYFGSWDGNFYALTSEGQEKWRFQTGGPVVSSAAIGINGQIVFGSNDKKVYCLNPNGAKLWDFPTRGAVISSPAIGSAGEVYFSSVDGKLYALNPDGGKRWDLQTGGITSSSPVLDEKGNIYLCANTNYLALNPSGKEIWRRVIWDHPYKRLADGTGAALANGDAVFFGPDGWVIAIAPDGDWVWSFWLYGSSVSAPLVGPGGIIYATGLSTGLNALDRNVPLARSPWPVFRANPQRTGRVSATP